VGQTIPFSGKGNDPEQGILPSDRLSWNLILHHCPDNCHTHVLQTYEGVASGEFVAPDHEFPSHLELVLTVTDSLGQSDSASTLLQPDTVTLTVDSDPSGLLLTFGNATDLTPFSRTVIVGSENGLGASDPQERECVSYQFLSWSDGGERTHTITAPAEATTLIATFEETSTCKPPVLCPGDCNNDRMVDVAELVLLVNMTLSGELSASCPSADSNADGTLAIDDLVLSIAASLQGCPEEAQDNAIVSGPEALARNL
jgi:hypothetical protein